MPDDKETTHSAEIVAESTHVTADDLCEACGVTVEDIMAYVSESIIHPLEPTPEWGGERWVFSYTSIIAVQRAKRLETDLGLNAAGIALAFDLMAEIDTLKRRLARHEMRSDPPRQEG